MTKNVILLDSDIKLITKIIDFHIFRYKMDIDYLNSKSEKQFPSNSNKKSQIDKANEKLSELISLKNKINS